MLDAVQGAVNAVYTRRKRGGGGRGEWVPGDGRPWGQGSRRE